MRSSLSGFILLRRSFQSEVKVALRHLKSSTASSSQNQKNKAKSPLHDLLISMPKEPVHVPLLKSQRTAKKEVTSKFPAGYINLDVLGNGAKGAPAALYVFTDQSRYLFNCGEGTQRLAHEHKMKLAKLEHIFLTSSSWHKMGGLPGVALTVQDIGVPSITLHGPPGLEDLFEGTRRFVILKDLQIRVADCSGLDMFYEDHVMRIDYVPLLPTKRDKIGHVDAECERLSQEAEETDDIDYYAPIKGCKRNLQIEGRMDKKARLEGPSEEVVSYICRPKPKAGALMIEKCLEYGVPSGPLLGQLKRGEDVTLSNGILVRASSVRSPDAPTTTFIVVDCPREEYLDSLTSNGAFTKFQGDNVGPDDFVHVIVHFTPKEVLTHPAYLDWMGKFPLSTQHLLLNDFCEGMGSEAVHRAQFQLNQLDSEMFPILHGQDTGQRIEKKGALAKAQLQIIYGTSQIKFKLRPSIGLDTSSQVVIKGEDFVTQLNALPLFPPALAALKAEQKLNGLDKPASDFPKFTFLGTGSCIPNKTRNVSGILLRISPTSCIVLDCGEGTYGQLVRFFGEDQVEDILVQLNGIYISHLHADHHLGLINLLQRREAAFHHRKVPFRPTFLVAPAQIQSWLHLYCRRFEPLRHLYELVPTTSLIHLHSSLEPTTEERFYSALELVRIETIGVRHCPNSYGVSLTGLGGWKVTYSGDTMPCDYLVTLGQNSDLLIHEATMEDELKGEAELKMHSTVSEAIEIGKRMNAKFTMLTHFSQRYAKVPKINGDLDRNVGIAFDNMTLGLSDLWKVPFLYPTLKTMFAEHYEEMEIKTGKKLRRKEREENQLITKTVPI